MAGKPYRKPHGTRVGMSLLGAQGERKYLCASERQQFYAALSVLDDPKDRTFCEMIYWTGCRPSEALGLQVRHIDLEERVVVIRSLKKRGEQSGKHYRPVPLPDDFLDRLAAIHGLHTDACDLGDHLWRFSRTTGWLRMRAVMEAAGLVGTKACARGLRHSYGVHAAMTRIPETRIKRWLGHASLATTAVYMDMATPEDRRIAERMWLQ